MNRLALPYGEGWDEGVNQRYGRIFLADEVERLNEDALKAYVSKSEIVKDKDTARITIKRNAKGYTFVNFNFVTA